MALPQSVINQLSNEPAETQGWFSGIIVFSTIILLVALGIYFGMKFGYEPYLNNQINGAQSQINSLSQSIPSGNEAQLLTFYSQISNLQSVLASHVTFSRFLTWVQQNTQNNITYTQLSFSSASGNEIALSALAPTEADVNQQLAIFESSPDVQSLSITSVGTVGANGAWGFGVSLILNPNLFVTTPTSQ
jgi:hypothetical protein